MSRCFYRQLAGAPCFSIVSRSTVLKMARRRWRITRPTADASSTIADSYRFSSMAENLAPCRSPDWLQSSAITLWPPAENKKDLHDVISAALLKSNQRIKVSRKLSTDLRNSFFLWISSTAKTNLTKICEKVDQQTTGSGRAKLPLDVKQPAEVCTRLNFRVRGGTWHKHVSKRRRPGTPPPTSASPSHRC